MSRGWIAIIVGALALGILVLVALSARLTVIHSTDDAAATKHVAVKAGSEEIFELAAEEFGLHEGFHVHRVDMHPIRINVAMERTDGIRVRIVPEPEQDHFTILIYSPRYAAWRPIWNRLEPELRSKLGDIVEFAPQ